MKKFVPSNGTEFQCFFSDYCDKCKHERYIHFPNEDRGRCEILNQVMLADNPEDSPEELQYIEGKPVCTKWEYWDWGNENDGFNEPEPEEEIDPNQLSLFEEK